VQDGTGKGTEMVDSRVEVRRDELVERERDRKVPICFL